MIVIIEMEAVKWVIPTCFKRSATALLCLAFRALFVGCVESPSVLPAFAALTRVRWKRGGKNARRWDLIEGDGAGEFTRNRSYDVEVHSDANDMRQHTQSQRKKSNDVEVWQTLALASRSYFSSVRSSTMPLRNKMCPLIVLLPASTWPMNTTLTCFFILGATAEGSAQCHASKKHTIKPELSA